MARQMREVAPNVAIVIMYIMGETFDASVCDAVAMAPSPDILIRAIHRALRKKNR
jgi:hypothetical protein